MAPPLPQRAGYQTQPNAGIVCASGGWPVSCIPVAPRAGAAMERGVDFLKSQINNAVMQHGALLKNLEDHERQADDVRYRDLCSAAIPLMRDHQRMLEDY